MNNKAFAEMDYKDESDIESLFYVCELSDTPLLSFADFKSSLNDELISSMIANFERETLIASQFKEVLKKQSEQSENISEYQPIYIKDIVSYLIMGGLDANYAMNDMELCDLPLFIDANEKRTKEILESDRLWSFMSLLPHLTKQIKSPTDLYPFPWEVDQIKRDAEKSIEENKKKLESFLNSGNSLLK